MNTSFLTGQTTRNITVNKVLASFSAPTRRTFNADKIPHKQPVLTFVSNGYLDFYTPHKKHLNFILHGLFSFLHPSSVGQKHTPTPTSSCNLTQIAPTVEVKGKGKHPPFLTTLPHADVIDTPFQSRNTTFYSFSISCQNYSKSASKQSYYAQTLLIQFAMR